MAVPIALLDRMQSCLNYAAHHDGEAEDCLRDLAKVRAAPSTIQTGDDGVREADVEAVIRVALARAEGIRTVNPVAQAVERTNIVVDAARDILAALASPPVGRVEPGTAKTVADILTAAADLIEPEGKWTQDAYSRGPDGQATDDGNEAVAIGTPVCWCAMGAIAEVTGHDPRGSWSNRGPAQEAYRVLLWTIPDADVPEWNDAPERTQAEVVAALRAAAEKARTAAETGSPGMSEANAPIPQPQTEGDGA